MKMKASFFLQQLGVTSLLLLAGFTFSTAFAQERGTWTTLEPMPTARGYVTGAEMDGKIYVFGGVLSPTTSSDDVEMYDIGTGTWVAKNKLPEEMCCMAAVTLGEKIYLIGGASSFTSAAWNKVYEYDPALDTYIALPNMPAARAFMAASELGGEIYAIGGLSDASDVYSSVIKFNPANALGWTNVASLNTPRHLPSSEVVEGKIYVTGGVVSAFGALLGLATTEVFDPGSPGSWALFDGDLAVGRFMHGSGAVDGNLYVFGGASSNEEFMSMERLDIQGGGVSWSDDAPMTSTRRAFASVEANGKIYVAGGISEAAVQNKFEVFDLSVNAKDDRKPAKAEALLQNKPNPFAGQTTIGYEVFLPGEVEIKLHDMTGKLIKTLVGGWQFPGDYTVSIDANGLNSGIYFYTMKTERGEHHTRKMVVIK